MNRRGWLKTGAMVGVGGWGLALSVGCGQEGGASRVPGALRAAAPAALAKLPFDHMLRFLDLTDGKVVSDGIEPWVTRLPEPHRAAVESANELMLNNGNFTDFSRATVREVQGAFTYPVLAPRGINMCAPFFSLLADGTSKSTFVEGPALTGLSHAAAEWPSATGVSAAQALVPLSTLQRAGSSFERTMQRPAVMTTAAGLLEVFYASDPLKGTGVVRVTALRENGQRLLDKEYPIIWT